MKKILQKEAAVLREISQEVSLETIKTPKFKTILKEMKEALDSQDDGVAIAAPQIGYPLRIFIVSRKVKEIIEKSKDYDSVSRPEQSEGNKSYKAMALTDLVFINPVIKKISKERKVVEEGCLSVRYLYGQVSRSKKATVEAYNENGEKFSRGGSGLMAQIFQHEIDHLDGILFIDKAKHIEEILPEVKTKHAKKDE